MIAFSKLAVASALVAASTAARDLVSRSNDTASFTANMLQESMDWMDMYYDSERGYLFDLGAAALVHDTRSSAWYAAGLLARNKNDDVDQAVRIVTNIIQGQFKNESEQWYVGSCRRDFYISLSLSSEQYAFLLEWWDSI